MPQGVWPKEFHEFYGNSLKFGIRAQDAEDGKGVKVLDVDDESTAAKAGIKEGDVITRFDGKDLNSVTALTEAARAAKDKISVKVEAIKSSPLKASPSGFEPTSPEARAAIESIIKDSYAWFKNLVQERRHLTDDQLAAVDDGRVFTGHQGLDLKLIDQIGDERTAIAWLEKEKNITANLPVRDYRLHSRLDDLPFLHAAALAVLDAVGLDGLAQRFGSLGGASALDRFNLDGLLALWQPDGAN